jgi:hypothetical protein
VKSASRARAAELLFLALVAILAYAPSLKIGLIADDYPNLSQARTWGAPSGLSALLRDSQFRLRSTSYWAMYSLWSLAGWNPLVYRAASLLLHICNCWLLFGLCLSWPILRPAAFYAVAFFAVHEGHQEAVMWFSAINELLMFFFGLAALACWAKSSAAERPSWKLEILSAALFSLAILSKESAVFLFLLFLLPAMRSRGLTRGIKGFPIPGRPAERPAADEDVRPTILVKRLWPHAVLCALGVASILSSRGNSFRFSDGSFSLAAPFWITWPQSFARLLWIWGWPALALILVCAPAKSRRAAWIALAWIGIALIPYSFLTYSTRIPSRQTYLASAGLAFLFGLAAAYATERWPQHGRLLAAVLVLMLAHNTIYLWTKKRAQFEQRAAPTDQLIALARGTPAPIDVACFPLPSLVAEEAVRLAAGRSPDSLVWGSTGGHDPKAVTFCYREPR